jgi:3,4-dihydroxy 2-butanone 4-phosphate synthase/GTP cyclohydrolase II
MSEFTFNSIDEALEDLRNGKVIVVVDDEDRENEGDFIAAAEMATPEMINFMATHGRGLICTPLTEKRCEELELNLMVKNNTVLHETQFTVSIDLIGQGCTTGISVHDRAKTIKALVDPATKPSDLGRPGHIFPLRAKKGGVLRRTGHTEAGIDLARLAGFQPAGILVEILNEDGSMARLPELMVVAQKFDLKIISIEQLIEYRLKHDSLIDKVVDVKMPTKSGDFQLHAYKEKISDQEHLALVKGTWDADEPVLVRVHSSCITGDIFGSCRCDCGPQLEKSM